MKTTQGFLLGIALALAFFPVRAATFTVTVTTDSGPGSLRAAITNANATPGPDIIAFNLPGSPPFTIAPTTALPVIAEPLTIDGTTQPGFAARPLIELSGASAPAGSSGLRIATSNSVVRGLVVNRWRANGIELGGAGGHVVERCFIGVGPMGTNDLGNSLNGILIADSPNNRVGATAFASGNVISGNEDHGIRINGVNSVGNQILGNTIGLDESGAVDLGNTDHGILLDQAVGTVIGGETTESGNLISGNNGYGIRAQGVGARATVIRRNVIGPDRSGLVDRGNNLDGISINGVPNTTIGGPDAGNLISGNGGAGIRLEGAGTTNSVVAGNRIGTDDTGAQALANTGAGIEVASNASFNRIGGVNPNEGNTLAFNGSDGAFVNSGTNNAVRGNTHFGNGGLGLDVGGNGIQQNDATDADTGANQLQNFPIITRAILRPGATEIVGELRSAANATFALDIFANESPDPSGNGEGQQFLGAFNVTTDLSGLARFSNSLPAGTSLRFITATATDPAGNTSEFSPAHRALTTATPNNFIVTTAADSGPGSLRQALADATNALNLGDRVTFNLPGAGPHTISPAAALPVLAAPVTIDGYSQPGASANSLANGFNANLRIMLDGNAAPAGVDGLRVAAVGATIRGLMITRFKGDGIEMDPISSGTVIEGNVIGLGADGSDQGQNGSGILVNGSAGHLIGGTTPAARNIISGNGRHGVELLAAGSTGNRIEGNWIGLGLDGELDRGNSQQGIRCDNASANFLGGSAVGAGNRIAGNDQNGIDLGNAGASNNVVRGNLIGLSAAGAPLRNNVHGISVNTVGSLIGGPQSGEGNRIAFNGQRGVSVLGGTNNAIRGNTFHANEGIALDLGNNNRTANDAGDADTGANQLQNFPVLTEARLDPGQTRIVGALNGRANTAFQLDFFASPTSDPTGSGEGNQHLGSSEVATDSTGNASFEVTLPATGTGRFISATATDSFGNTSEFATNVVAASSLPPQTFTVTTTADSGPGSLRQALLDADAAVAGSAHTIRFNIPGAGPHTIAPQTPLPIPANEAVIVDGFTQPGSKPNALASGSDAILKVVLDGTDRPVDYGLRFTTSGNTVRGLSVVSFRQNGLHLGGSSNIVEGCWIGLLPDGTAKQNNNSGILLARDQFGGQGSADNRIGGATPAQRNVISGQDGGNGVNLPGGGSSNNVVIGNYIGTDPSGTAARPNRVGVNIGGANTANNRVGGSAAGEGNLISGNRQFGIRTSGGSTTLIFGNRIGADINGGPLPNGEQGITVNNSPGTIVGGIASGQGNQIAFNGRSGVDLSSEQASTNLTVRGNSIFKNGQLGFDIGSFGFVEFNDLGDTDTGPNFRQNFPVITAATVEPAQVRISGTLDTLPNQTYALDFYASQEADPSSHGEGEEYLGSASVTTDGAGDASFEVTFARAAVGVFITAIATDPAGNSSEFSAAFQATSTIGGETYVVTNTQDSGAGSLRQAILDSNGNVNAGNRIEFQIPGVGPHLIAAATPLPPIAAPVTIDGYSQSGAQPNTLPNGNNAILKVHLDAPPANLGAGLTLVGQRGIVRGLAITGHNPGVSLRGTNNTIAGCWIGLRPDGTERGNQMGVWVDNSLGNAVGGSAPADRNVISGNRQRGVFIGNSRDCVVAGNFIGADPEGAAAIPNESYGVTSQSSSGLLIGGTSSASRNVIVGHTIAGVELDGQTGHLIANNFVGLAASGTLALPNGTGVSLRNVAGSRVDANVISGNSQRGVHVDGFVDGFNRLTGNLIGTDSTGQLPFPNAGPGVVVTATTSLLIGGENPGESNTIAFNQAEGISATAGTTVGVSRNRIFSNGTLGLDRHPFGQTPNDLNDADDTTNFPEITAATVGANDVQLSGRLQAAPNRSYRLEFFASAEPDPSGFGEGAQFLGSLQQATDASGQALFSPTFSAVASGRWISATATDPSGDTSEFGPAFRAESSQSSQTFTVSNTLDSGAGSLRQAILDANGVQGASNNLIRFNIPGTGPHMIAPLSLLPELTEAITIDGFTQPGSAPNTSVEGDSAVRRIHLVGANLPANSTGLRLSSPRGIVRGLEIRDFTGAGIRITGASNSIEGCRIASNQIAGVLIEGGGGHQIGGPLPAQRNHIVANQAEIQVGAAAGPGSRIQGNLLRMEADGTTPTVDARNAIFVESPSPILVGGSQPGEGNRLGGGVVVIAGAGKTVRGNLFFARGIYLPGDFLLPNDPGDGDTGPNGLQNYPELTAATAIPAGTRVTGFLNSRPNASYTLDFYVATSNAPVRMRYLGNAAVSTDGTGTAVFDLTLVTPTLAGRVTATATDAEGSTSQISPGVPTRTEIPPPTYIVTVPADSGIGSLRQAILDSNDIYATGPSRIHFNIPGAGPHMIGLLSPLPVVTQATTLDGLTQPGAVPWTDPEIVNAQLQIQLHGGQAGPNADGLVLVGRGQVVRGLILTGFGGRGIALSNAPGSRIEQNWIGHDGRSLEVEDPRVASRVIRLGGVIGSEELAGLRCGTAIDIVSSDALSFLPGLKTEIQLNAIANQSVSGIRGLRVSDVLIQGNRIGQDLAGRALGPSLPVGIELNDVARVEVVRGPQTAGFGRNHIGNCEQGVILIKTRQTTLEENFIGGGYYGDWALANGTAIFSDNSTELQVLNNVATFNHAGFDIIGESSGSRFTGNVLNDNLSFGARLGPTATGIQFGGFSRERGNFFGRGVGSPFILRGQRPQFGEYNSFGAFGSGLFADEALFSPTKPRVTLDSAKLFVDNFTADPFSRLLLYTGDRWNQLFSPQGGEVFQGGETSYTFPLSGPYATEAFRRKLGITLNLGQAWTRPEFVVEGGADLGIDVIGVGSLGADSGTANQRWIAEVRMFNSGTTGAVFRATVSAPSATALYLLPLVSDDFPTSDLNSIPLVSGAKVADSELEFTGRLLPGEAHTKLIGGIGLQSLDLLGQIFPLDRTDTSEANNFDAVGMTPSPTTRSEFELIELNSFATQVGSTAVFNFRMINNGPDDGTNVSIRVPDDEGIVWEPADTAEYRAIRQDHGLVIVPKLEFEAGDSLLLSLTYRATQTPAYSLVPISLAGNQNPGDRRYTWRYQPFEVFDPLKLDRGDAPDSYGTTIAANGPTHYAVPGFQLGFLVDHEANGLPGADAEGDDDDGVFFVDPLVPGQRVVVEVQASARGALDAWFDWNRNGRFETRPSAGVNEYLPDTLIGHPTPGTSYPLQPGMNRLHFFVPAGADTGSTYARFRFSHLGGLGPSGAGQTGEVEDYFVEIYPQPPDFGDAPDFPDAPGYPTLRAHGGAIHFLTPESPRLGDARDAEAFPEPDVVAFGDDVWVGTGVPDLGPADDEDGVSLLGFLRVGQPAFIRVVTTVPSGTARLDGWIDWNADFDWSDAGEKVAHSIEVASGTNVFTIQVPAEAIPGITYARIRISPNGGLDPGGAVEGGEVEDYQVTVSPPVGCQISSYVRQGNNLLILWEGSGTLQQAPELEGPWSTAPNQSPGSALIPMSEAMRLFRLLCP